MSHLMKNKTVLLRDRKRCTARGISFHSVSCLRRAEGGEWGGRVEKAKEERRGGTPVLVLTRGRGRGREGDTDWVTLPSMVNRQTN